MRSRHVSQEYRLQHCPVLRDGLRGGTFLRTTTISKAAFECVLGAFLGSILLRISNASLVSGDCGVTGCRPGRGHGQCLYSGMACPDRSFTAVRWPSSDPVAISPALAQALPVAEAAAATFPGVPPAAIPAVKADWAAAHASELPPVARQPLSAASFHFSGVPKVAVTMPLFLLRGSDHFGQHVARAP